MLLALLLAQSVGAAAPPTGVPRGPSCASVSVVTPEGAAARSGFSAARVVDLELRVRVRPQTAGPHLLELKLYTPHGHLYQVLPVVFEGTASIPPREDAPARWQAAHPDPPPVQRATLVRTGRGTRQQVVATLPVAGTSIVATSLFGRWRVDAHLDGAPRSCGTPALFRLTP